ncbi:MAG: energy transducer TonB [Proteobacteria bacterium]|nr:energy transducer TonB [Pseudomonadota bacterium]MBS0461222.1 energy transducer TonB [Pseudomonadota bacterium]
MKQTTFRGVCGQVALTAAVAVALGLAGCGKKATPPAPGAVTPAASPAAAGPGAAEHVDTDAELLTKAKTAENEKRLYAPAGNNAIEYYLQLRARNPNDETVKSALTDLFPYAMIATEQNLKKGDEAGRQEAARIFALLERVDANAPSLPRLRTMMQKEAADELKQQQDAAKKAQADLEKKAAADKAAADAKLKQQQEAAASAAASAASPAHPAQTTPTPAPTHTAPVPTHTATNPPPAASPVAETPPPPPKPARAPGSLPAVVSSVQPEYPRAALRDNVSGEVTVAFTVNADGSVSGASVIKADPKRVFDAAALDAIRKWKFEAPGEPVSGKRTFVFNPGN